MSPPNALTEAWKARSRLWERHTLANGKMGRPKEISREEMDSLLANVIYAIEEERQQRTTDKLFELLEEHGLLEKAIKSLETKYEEMKKGP